MNYSISNNKILINDTSEFLPKHIVECGQVFRYQKTDSGYKIFSKNLFCGLIYSNGCATIETTEVAYFVNYFDLNRDYGAIKQALLGYPNLANSINFGRGLRILNQNPTEMILSFIISANNNIPRIQGIIGRLCATSGEPMQGGYNAFPTIDDLAGKSKEYYAGLGAGYRADYLVKTVDALKGGFELDLSGMDTVTARKHLMRLTGVGRKVAECILLFGYHRAEVFPVDTWIEKVYDELFGANDLTPNAKADKLSGYFGGLSGYAQQYLYYYARENHNK